MQKAKISHGKDRDAQDAEKGRVTARSFVIVVCGAMLMMLEK